MGIAWASDFCKSSGIWGDEPMEIEEAGEGATGERRRPKKECICGRNVDGTVGTGKCEWVFRQ
jgi:hypothetical protein